LSTKTRRQVVGKHSLNKKNKVKVGNRNDKVLRKCISIGDTVGGAENDGHENDDIKIARHEIAGHEIARHDKN